MEQISAKTGFLREDYAPLLQRIDSNMQPLFGKMNPQQMVEHMAEYIRIGYGNPEPAAILTAEDILPKMRAFLESEKPFRENTPNALMPDTPPAVRHAGMAEAISDLQLAVSELLDAFAAEPGKTVRNPFFGMLDAQQTIQLLHKHAWHHLRQFGVNPS